MSAADIAEHSEPAALAVGLSGACLSYGATRLFDGLDLTLQAGRFTCLLGPTGVGKSSLLRLIAGLAPTATMRELVCSDGRSPAGRIAYMAQQDGLLPWSTVLDNVLLGARLRGEPPDPARARALLEEVGLAHAGHLRPAALSGGMRQRAALARTLMENRPLVLMDEPFSAVDALTRLRLQDLAARLLRGRTVLLVTHDPLEALRLGDVVLVLSGSPATLHAATLPPEAPPRDARDPAVHAATTSLLDLLQGGNGAPA